MAARNRARYLAPLALVATIAGTYLVVHSALSTKTTKSHPAVVLPTSSTGHKRPAPPRFYIVKQGESMSTIAAKTGVPLNTIESLNHSVDPNALQAGQRLRIRR